MNDVLISDVARNLFLINSKIKKSCQIYGQDKTKVNLVAISKTKDVAKIQEAIAAGCKIFGENYIQETQEKWPEIRNKFPAVELHFVGHLQSNKAKIALELFDVIQTLDSEKLAQTFQKEIAKSQRNPQFFVQVNIGEESQKNGIAPQDVKNFVEFCRKDCGLNITGLMCIPPSNEAASPYFALLKKLARENNIKNLSMGMSADFEEAIALGATHIRVGTAIFGERN